METLNDLSHLIVVERDDGTIEIVKGSFNQVLGTIRTNGRYATFEPQDNLLFHDLEAIAKIIFAVNLRISDNLNK